MHYTFKIKRVINSVSVNKIIVHFMILFSDAIAMYMHFSTVILYCLFELGLYCSTIVIDAIG